MATKSINTSIANIPFASCIYNAAGAWDTTDTQLNDIKYSNSGAIVSKSSTIASKEGNPLPRYYEDEWGTINSTGLANHGFRFYLDYGNTYTNKPYVHSIAPFSQEEMVHMLTIMNSESKGPRLVEINLSCPNVPGHPPPCYDFELFESHLTVLQSLELDNLILGLKLPPYYMQSQFDRVAELISGCPSIRFIVMINSLYGMLVDVDNEQTGMHAPGGASAGMGGVGGGYALPVTLSCIRNFYLRLGDSVDIVGVGGCLTGRDAFAMILCGAKAVQIGSQLMKEGPGIFTDVNRQLMDLMAEKGYTSIEDFRGKLKVKPID